MTIAGLILSGGRSSRMGGGEKSLLPLLGVPLVRHCITRLSPQVDMLAINANREVDTYAGFDLPVIRDTIPDYAGPLAGVLAGMRWAADAGASHVASVAADTPFFPVDLVARLHRGRHTGDAIAMATTPDPIRKLSRHPTFALWPVALADDLEAALQDGVRKIVAWTDRHGTSQVVFDIDRHDPFFNVNTPDDMLAAETIAAELGM